MSDDIKTTESFLKQIERLNAEAAQRRQKAKALRTERDAVLKERDELRSRLEALGSEHDALRQRFEAEPSTLHREVEQLRGELRQRDHRDCFRRIAAQAQVRPEAMEDLWALSGYQPTADQPDEQSLTELVERARAARPYLFQSPAEAGKSDRPGGPPPAAPVPGPARPPGPGVSRGVPDSTSGGVIVRQHQLRDPHWMRFNQAAIAEASRKGSLTILPD